jgi:hypothetical protein
MFTQSSGRISTCSPYIVHKLFTSAASLSSCAFQFLTRDDDGIFQLDIDEKVKSSSDILDDFRQGLALCAIKILVKGIEGTYS